MKVCINDNCYTIIRVIPNGTSYEKSILESIRDQFNADTMINDNSGNILMCRKMLNYELNSESNVWECIDKREVESIEGSENNEDTLADDKSKHDMDIANDEQ